MKLLFHIFLVFFKTFLKRQAKIFIRKTMRELISHLFSVAILTASTFSTIHNILWRNLKIIDLVLVDKTHERVLTINDVNKYRSRMKLKWIKILFLFQKPWKARKQNLSFHMRWLTCKEGNLEEITHRCENQKRRFGRSFTDDEKRVNGNFLIIPRQHNYKNTSHALECFYFPQLSIVSSTKSRVLLSLKVPNNNEQRPLRQQGLIDTTWFISLKFQLTFTIIVVDWWLITP